MQPVISIVIVHIAMTCVIRILPGLSSNPNSADESKSIGITTTLSFRSGIARASRSRPEVVRET